MVLDAYRARIENQVRQLEEKYGAEVVARAIEAYKTSPYDLPKLCELIDMNREHYGLPPRK